MKHGPKILLSALAFANVCTSAAKLSDVRHFIVIYQENWSFDGLLGKFPGANGIDSASSVAKTQVDSSGAPYTQLPFNDSADFHSQLTLANNPWDMTTYLNADGMTEDLVHRYYQQQYQIDGGKNDRYVAGSDAQGLSMSYVDATLLPLGVLGSQGVVFDHFFHSAFGGSFLNHQWLVSAQTPHWPAGMNAPASRITKLDSMGNRKAGSDGYMTPDSFVINTIQPWTWPYYPGTKDSVRLPLLDQTTIADRLDDAGISWAWYTGGYDSAIAGDGLSPNIQYQFHHQPFNYYRKFSDTASMYRKSHLKDESWFFADLAAGTLPSVVWIKPEGEQNEHPGYATLVKGQNHVKALIDSLKNYPSVWDSTVVLITYDENGGRWDHVAPPVIDKWGPGARVPTVLVSPLSRHGFVDKKTYETVSTLSFIERRWNLKPLSPRDSMADPLSGAFDFQMPTNLKPGKSHRHHLSLSSAPLGQVAVHRDESSQAVELEARDLAGRLLGRRILSAGQSDAKLDVGSAHGLVVVRSLDAASEGPVAIVR